MFARLRIIARRALLRRPLALAACSTMLAAASLGCGGSPQLRAGLVFDYPVYYVDQPPALSSRYPRAYYRGRPAYLVDGRWYYSTPRGWVVFRREPPELRYHRETRSARRDAEQYRNPRRDRSDEPTERRHRERWDTRPSDPTERRYRRVDPD